MYKINTSKNDATIRELLFLFIRQIFTEGVALYYEMYTANGTIFFSEDEFNNNYVNSQKRINSVMLGITTFLENRSNKEVKTEIRELITSLEKQLKMEHYVTGYYLVYTILYLDHRTTFEDLLKLQPFEFIKKYEACMKIKGLQPVVSATSGDGIFDYKTVLTALTAAAKK